MPRAAGAAPIGARVDPTGSLRAAFVSVWRPLGYVALVGSVVFLGWKVAQFESTGALALDFKLGAAQRLVDGDTLYPANASGEYPYPPLWAMLVSPFLLVPIGLAKYLACTLCASAIVAGLWIVGTRDPWCFAAALVSDPVVGGTQIGNVSAFVVLLLALGYRHNSAPLGLAVALKLYAWPLVLWSALRRGARDLVLGVGVAVAAIVVPWAAIGFDGILRFPSVARDITAGLETYALPPAVGIGVAVAALVTMWLRRGDSVGSFSFAILAVLAATPVLWAFYFAAVLLPLALRRPRFSVAWLIPFLVAVLEGQAYTWVFIGLLVWCGVGAPSLGQALSSAGRRPRRLVIDSDTPEP